MQDMRANAPEMIGKVEAFTDSLTPEQRTELVAMMDKMGKRGRIIAGAMVNKTV